MFRNWNSNTLLEGMSIAFLYTNNEKLEFEIKNTIPVTLAPKKERKKEGKKERRKEGRGKRGKKKEKKIGEKKAYFFIKGN